MTASRRRRAAGQGVGGTVLRGVLLLVFGASVYSLSLLATAPARVVERYMTMPPQVEALGGTIWNGSVLLAGGHRLAWRLDRQGSIKALAPLFDITLDGPGTRLAAQGEVSPRGTGGMLRNVTGRASWPLVAAFAPDAPPLDCDPVAVIDLARVLVGRDRIGAEGDVRSPAGSCTQTARPEHAAVPVPALALRATMEGDVSRAMLEAAQDGGTVLAEASIARARTLALTVYPAGARLVPGLPSSAPIGLEMELPPLTAPLRPDR